MAAKSQPRRKMAAASLEVKKKNPQSGKIVVLPGPGGSYKAIVCVATGLPCPRAFFGDRAQNTFPFLNPYVGMLMARNLSEMMRQENGADSTMPERLYPGVTPRLLAMVKSNLTRESTYDPEVVTLRTADIKGKKGAHAKFIQALEGDIVAGPMVWSPDTLRPFLPVSMALAQGFSWPEIIEEMSLLLERSVKFQKHWGWHGAGLCMRGSELHQRRKERRVKKATDDE